MNAPDLYKKEHAQGGGRGPGMVIAKFMAGKLSKMLDHIDAGIEHGSIRGRLPDGTTRILGGRSPGHDAEMNIRNWRALLRVARTGSVGLYEGWAAGEWDSPDPVEIFALFMANRRSLNDLARPSPAMRLVMRALHAMRRNSRSGARRNIEFHYDLGNDFYTGWLDPSMTYSSAYFGENPTSNGGLEEAQRCKNQKLLDRLGLKSGDHLLEIGCGWGGLAEQALSAHKVQYHGITLSTQQRAFAQNRLQQFGEHAHITITDYRDVRGQYDAIASVEMVEAVGQEYWGVYLDSIARNLKPGGRAAIQYIYIEDDVFEQYARNVDFIQRYIFPGGMLISQRRFFSLAKERGLSRLDQESFGMDYARTLRMWRENFDHIVAQGQLPAGFDEKFIRLWRFYLMYCEGGFRGGGINVAQVTLTK